MERNAKYQYVLPIMILCLMPVLMRQVLQKQIIIKLKYPDAETLSLNSVWRLSQINNRSTVNYTVYLHGIVSVENKGNWLWDAYSSPFLLPAGYSADSVSFSSLKPISGFFNPALRNILENISENDILPDGTYIFCVFLVEANTSEVLSHDCIQISRFLPENE